MNKNYIPDLSVGATSVTLVLSGGSGQIDIPDYIQKIGLSTGSTQVRVGLAIPATAGSASGSLTSSALVAGIPISASPVYGTNWFEVGSGVNRTLYCIGGATDQIVVIFA